METNILSILIFFPLLGILGMFIAYMLKQSDIVFKYIALFTTSVQLLLTVWLYFNFDPSILLSSDISINPVKFSVQVPWIDNFNIQSVSYTHLRAHET